MDKNGVNRRERNEIFSTKDLILKLAFFDNEMIDEELTKKLIAQIKSLNKELRRVGVFKNKLKKGWKLSE
jgi:hypothetical protein